MRSRSEPGRGGGPSTSARSSESVSAAKLLEPQRQSQRASAEPVHNITKSATPLEDVCPVTGEITPEFNPLQKWELQSVARLALGDRHRINVCMRHVRADRSEVDVRRSQKSGRPYYAGLMACGSVWVCPVCAPKIQAVRAAEVRAAIDAWQGAVVLLTQTVPHSHEDELQPLLGRFTEALRLFKAGSPYKRASQRFRIAGSIRALEVTHGRNGWHPHAHTILFLEGHHDQGAVHVRRGMKAELFRLWESAAARAGFKGKLSPSAFDLQDASKVQNYVTKMGTEYRWGPEHELVKAHSKTGSRGSSPFDMLRHYDPEINAERSSRRLVLFAEYALAFHGRRQLVWSDGLKTRLLGTEGLTDQQIADSTGEVDAVLARIPYSDWRIIRKHNLQGHVLENVNKFGASALEFLLAEFRHTPVKGLSVASLDRQGQQIVFANT